MSKYLMIFILFACFVVAIGMQETRVAGEASDTKESWYEQGLSLSLEGKAMGSELLPDQLVTNREWVTILAEIFKLPDQTMADFPKSNGAMAAALERKWYDWDEIPPTGETYEQPITRELAIKIAINALGKLEHGLYEKWQPAIRDFDSLNGRYYDSIFSAYEHGIVLASQYRASGFQPLAGFSRQEACELLECILISAGKLDWDTLQAILKADGQEERGDLRMGGVSENGELQVIDTQLSNSRGEPVVLRGMSSHGMQWYPQFASYEAIKTTKDYGANLFRIAMYTQEKGYLVDASVKEKVIAAVDAAIGLDMYVIIDWHILSDGDPLQHMAQAKEFFKEMALRYQNNPAVIYEICNEPNGDITWENNIYPYAQEVIGVIREISPNAVVLVGTERWCGDVLSVSEKMLPFDNVMYSFHFYAGSHGAGSRTMLLKALAQGIPIFVTEWGLSKATGGSGTFLTEGQEWIRFMDEQGLSWANWSLSNKDESSAALKPSTTVTGGWIIEDLSPSGAFVFQRFRDGMDKSR